ncbi:MAG: hypothetical protein QW495_05825 [Candidatus Hadarchaeum sp.]|uniref:hypothetical protein n=1 Tax=Candidatus Hadarchaeum sp. TaxID=2883567 RepID=UPI00317A694B
MSRANPVTKRDPKTSGIMPKEGGEAVGLQVRLKRKSDRPISVKRGSPCENMKIKMKKTARMEMEANIAVRILPENFTLIFFIVLNL